MNAAKAQPAPDARDRAREYIRAGFNIVPIPARSKGPVRGGWPHLRLTEKEVSTYFDRDSNIGLLLGVNGEADADLDCAEAVRIGAAWLPPTPAIYGRASKPQSHYLYRLENPLPTKRFKDPLAEDDDKDTLSEFRCLTSSGTVGCQSVLPGSVHPSGELIEWTSGLQQPAAADGSSLLQLTGRIAAASLFARHWPSKGKRHDTMLALIGTLAHAGWSEDETYKFCYEVALNARTGTPERTSQVKQNVKDTFRDYRAGNPTTGRTRLMKLLPEAVGTAVVEWLELPVSSRAQVDEWPDPLPLGQALPPVEPFDLQLLPDAFRPYVQDVAERMQVAPDFVAIPLTVAYSAATGRRVRVQPKAVDSTWLVVPHLWGGVVAPPGWQKTPTIMAATRALQEIERDAAYDYEAAQAEYAEEQRHHEVRLNAWKQLATRAYKTGEATIPACPRDEPQEPARKRYITNDATAEALHQILSENAGGVLNLRDELSGWLAQLDKPGREGDRAFWLEAWNGTGPYTMDRIGRGSIRTPACCVSVLGGIQPARLRSYLSQALMDAPGNDGLMQRFQLLAWPDLNGNWKYLDRLPNQDAQDRVTEIFKRAVSLNPAEPRIYKFDQDAQALFQEWIGELEALIRSNALHPALVSHLAKCRSLMPSLAVLFELADDAESTRISLGHAKQAADWCEYLRTHAERMYSCISSLQMHLAQDLAGKLKAGKLGSDSFTLRDLYLKQWTGLDTPESARSAVEVLIDANWVRCQSTSTGPKGGRPSESYAINPKVLHGDK